MSHWSTAVPTATWQALVCPYCRQALELTPTGLECAERHHFDLARHRYVSLLGKQSRTDTADTAAMVTNRAEFLDAGHYAPIAEAVATAVAEHGIADAPVPLLEVGAGTGHYLARAAAGRPGVIAVDSSRFAARQAGRALPTGLSVVADAWDAWPIADGSVGAVLSIFAPRNRPQIHRVLVPGGALVVVTPEPEHLGELVGAFGMLTVDVGKADKLAETFAGDFTPAGRVPVNYRLQLDPADTARLALMGPSAWHLDPETIAAEARTLGPVEVTVAVTVSVFRRN